MKKAGVVASAHTLRGIEEVSRLLPGRKDAPDAAEIRLDLLESLPSPERLGELPLPLIFTLRSEREGGRFAGTPAEKRGLLARYLPFAAAVDIELEDCGGSSALIDDCRRAGAAVILSYHNFRSTPRASDLAALCSRAASAGAQVFKAATHLATPRDICSLIGLIEGREEIPVAAMGMGPLGQPSRLYLAAAGSVLNYGWLDRPLVEGQLSAIKLAAALAEMGCRQP